MKDFPIYLSQETSLRINTSLKMALDRGPSHGVVWHCRFMIVETLDDGDNSVKTLHVILY